MSELTFIYAESQEWARGFEVSGGKEDGGFFEAFLNVEEGEYLAAAFSSAGESVISDDVYARLDSPDETVTYELSSGNLFTVDETPMKGKWRVRVSSEQNSPFMFNVAAFSSPPPGGGSPAFKCKACKITSKALAAAIVAAGTAAAAPAALIAAVSAYLGGIGTLAAAAFLASVVNNTVDEIAEKLCQKIGLCP